MEKRSYSSEEMQHLLVDPMTEESLAKLTEERRERLLRRMEARLEETREEWFHRMYGGSS